MSNIAISLINNGALLLTLSIIYEVNYIIPTKKTKIAKIISGIIIGLIGVSIMMVSFKLSEEIIDGVVLDARSVLISVTALIFGTVPAVIAALIICITRIFVGGAGLYAGLVATVAYTVIGLLWRNVLLEKKIRFRWSNIYLFGIINHIVMLLSMFLIPKPLSIQVLNSITLPVMIIFPPMTVLLCLLLIRQRERNEALISIAEAEGRYKSLFNNSHATMLIIDPNDGKIIDANPAASEFYGWSVEQLKTMKIEQINTLPLDELKSEMKKSVTNEKNQFFLKHRKSSGEIIEVEIFSGPINISGKTVIYSIVHDICERVAFERNLRESEKRFRMVVEGAPDAIFIQAEHRFAFLNKAAIELFGAESEEKLLGTSVIERFHKDYHNIALERIKQLNINKKLAPPLEQIYLKLDGTPIDVEVSAVPIEYKQKNGALVFVRDITERKKLEKSRIEIEAQLRQQQKLEAIGTLAGGVAHEINNPINGIMNYAQLILDSEEDSSFNEIYAKEIINETERVSEIVRNLLQFSRYEKQSHSYASIEDIIHRTLSLVNTIIKKDQIELVLDLEDNLPDIKCRNQQIQQVLMNILVNAKDALNEKYVGYDENKIIKLSCYQYINRDRKWIRITVEDHGNGIPQNVMEKIFEPFFSTKTKDQGTGLGLSISFGIIKDHHGKISIDTKEGQYTKFHLDLPVDNGWNLDEVHGL